MSAPNWLIASSPTLDRLVAADAAEESGDMVTAFAIRSGIYGYGYGDGDGYGYGSGDGYG